MCISELESKSKVTEVVWRALLSSSSSPASSLKRLTSLSRSMGSELSECELPWSSGMSSTRGRRPQFIHTNDLQLRLEMGINNRLYKEVRSCPFIFFVLYVFVSTHTQLQAFLRILIEKSDLDRIVPSKHQRGDELHKIFTVVCPSSPSPRFLNIACLILYSLTAEAYPVLNRFEHNWVAAGMV